MSKNADGNHGITNSEDTDQTATLDLDCLTRPNCLKDQYRDLYGIGLLACFNYAPIKIFLQRGSSGLLMGNKTIFSSKSEKSCLKFLWMGNQDCYMSLVMRKQAFCICENKDADQLRSYREADQRLCFRYTDSTIPLLP